MMRSGERFDTLLAVKSAACLVLSICLCGGVHADTLFPAVAGMTWKYQMIQEFGKGVGPSAGENIKVGRLSFSHDEGVAMTKLWLMLWCAPLLASCQTVSPAASPVGSVVSESISPNGRYGVFVVDSQEEDAKPKNLLVQVEPFQVVTAIGGEPFLKGYLKNTLAVTWAKDSSAVLVIVDGYWGINALQLVDLRKLGSVKQTDLLEAMVKISKRELHFWPHFHVSDTDVNWEISNGRRLRIACDGDTESNNLEVTPSYMHFEGVWNLEKTKWDAQKCTKTKAPD